MTIPILLFNGTLGVGKTSVAQACGVLLRAAGKPHALIDLDGLCDCHPAPPEDRFNERLLVQNLEAVSRNFSMAGARLFVAARTVETQETREAYRAAMLGGPLTCVRLTAPREEIDLRLQRRERNDELSWHLRRSAELDRILDAAGLDDFRVDTRGREVDSVAREVLARVGALGA